MLKCPKLVLGLCVSSLALLAACHPPTHDNRFETAKRLAYPNHMHERTIPTAQPVFAFERVHAPGRPAVIYIEGDGPIRFDFPVEHDAPSQHTEYTSERDLRDYTLETDPTPINPVALHLASRDLGRNVIYLARPCQYSREINQPPCPREAFTTRRYGPEHVETLNAALDYLAWRHQIPAFHLVGYDGGGAMAVHLAALRDDVASLRTVSAILDNQTVEDGLLSFELLRRGTRYHNQGNPVRVQYPLKASLDALDAAPHLADMPQHHFIGHFDPVAMTDIAQNFVTAVGPSECLRVSVVDMATHDLGWVNKWPELLQKPVRCGE